MSLKGDWLIATKCEKTKFILVIIGMITLSVVAVWQLWFLYDDNTVFTPAMRKILYSYAAFIAVIVLSWIKIKPKRKE